MAQPAQVAQVAQAQVAQVAQAQVAQAQTLAARVGAEISASKYKNISVEHQANFADFMRAQDTVKKYIQTHDCILYGGIAIDYALRLRGDKIYADNDIPDFDFWSPGHIETARELVAILSVLFPHVNVYATHAKFIRTMRVSVGDNSFVADISYVPRVLFDTTPTLTYDGMRIVHPHFQFSDLHSSLAFPYDGAPMEVVFARWKKDIERFNKLFAAYPIDVGGNTFPELAEVRVPREVVSHSILHGFAAYSAYYNILRDALPHDRDLAQLPSARRIRMTDEHYIIDVPHNLIDVMAHRDIVRAHLHEDGQKSTRKFYPFLDLLEGSIMTTIGASSLAVLTAYTSCGRMANYNSFTVKQSPNAGGDESVRVRAVGIHGLLKYFIAWYVRAKYYRATIVGPALAIPEHVFAMYYCACLKLIEKSRDCADIAPYFEPRLEVFGESAIPLHDLISLHDTIARIVAPDNFGEKIVFPPKNINADQTTADPFDYDSCVFLHIAGEEVLA